MVGSDKFLQISPSPPPPLSTSGLNIALIPRTHLIELLHARLRQERRRDGSTLPSPAQRQLGQRNTRPLVERRRSKWEELVRKIWKEGYQIWEELVGKI